MELSPQKKLKNLRSARDFVRKAEVLHLSVSYGPLYASLDSDEQSLVQEIEALVEAFKAPSALRVDFYSNVNVVKMVVRPPKDTEELPTITQTTWNALRTILHTEDVRVDAPYDVAVDDHGFIRKVIPGRKRTPL